MTHHELQQSVSFVFSSLDSYIVMVIELLLIFTRVTHTKQTHGLRVLDN